MNCPNCARSNPGDARFCIYCATRLVGGEPAISTTPATGPTTRLDPSVVPTYTMPAARPKAVPAARPRRSRSRQHSNESTWPLWLIGIGILLLIGDFFPGILVLIGVTKYVKETGRGRYRKAHQSLVFSLGLAAVFWFGLSWPLLLLWFGLMMLLNQHR